MIIDKVRLEKNIFQRIIFTLRYNLSDNNNKTEKKSLKPKSISGYV